MHFPVNPRQVRAGGAPQPALRYRLRRMLHTPAPSPSSTRLRAQGDFLRLLGARVSGGGANQMLMVALGWQMYDLTGSAWELGLVGLAQFLPALLLTLPAGHWVDRYDRRRLLAGSLGLQCAAALCLALASVQGWITPALIVSLSVLLGAARALQMPSQQALLPMLVPPTLLPRAVAASSATLQAAVIIGPALGGGLYALGPWTSRLLGATGDTLAGARWGAALVYGLSLVLLLLAIVCVLAIRQRQGNSRRPAPGLDELTAGIRFLWKHPVMLGAMSLDLFAMLLGGATALLPIFAKDILHTGPEGLGLLRSAPGVGAVLVGVALARFPVYRHAGPKLLGAVALFGCAILGFALATSFWPAFLALALSGAADMFSVVIRQSIVQLETPDEMRGRVGAVNSVFIGASNQLGEFRAGATAALLGPVASVLLGGIGTLAVVALWWRLFPALARRDRLHTSSP